MSQPRVLLALVSCLMMAVGVSAIPPHPTVLLAELNGLSVPVVRVVGTDPILSIDGKDRRIHFEASCSVARAPHFGEGHVDFKRCSFNGIELKSVMSPADDPAASGSTLGGTSYFEATMVPSIAIKGGFVALVLFDKKFLDSEVDDPAAEILIHDLQELPAGRESIVKFSTRLPSRRGQSGFFPLVFQSGGAELPSNFSVLIARYFSRVEEVRLAALLSDYRAKYAAADHAAEPVLKIQPVLTRGVDAPRTPIVVTMTVGENGHVREVQLPDGLESQLAIALRETLGGWLFLPRLKAGRPIPTRVQIPLTF